MNYSFIAFDLATKTGVAYYSNGWVTHSYKSVTIDTIEQLRPVIREARKAGIDMAVIEDCYLGCGVRALKMLAGLAGGLTVMLRQEGMAVKTCLAQQWQSNLRIRGQRTERKHGAMVTAKRLGADPKNQDEADAVCMCYYANCGGLDRHEH